MLPGCMWVAWQRGRGPPDGHLAGPVGIFQAGRRMQSSSRSISRGFTRSGAGAGAWAGSARRSCGNATGFWPPSSCFLRAAESRPPRTQVAPGTLHPCLALPPVRQSWSWLRGALPARRGWHGSGCCWVPPELPPPWGRAAKKGLEKMVLRLDQWKPPPGRVGGGTGVAGPWVALPQPGWAEPLRLGAAPGAGCGHAACPPWTATTRPGRWRCHRMSPRCSAGS